MTRGIEAFCNFWSRGGKCAMSATNDAMRRDNLHLWAISSKKKALRLQGLVFVIQLSVCDGFPFVILVEKQVGLVIVKGAWHCHTAGLYKLQHTLQRHEFVIQVHHSIC